MTNFGHETGNLHDKMIKNISEPLDIIPEQNYPAVVTNNSKLYEADHSSLESLKDLSFEKENLHEKIMNSFSQTLEFILERNPVELEVSTSNSALQEV